MSPVDAGSEAVKRLDSLYEFERAPVTEDRLQPGSYFAGLFSGEHVAATEFVIGALFVSFGASATDIVVGPAPRQPAGRALLDASSAPRSPSRRG